MPTFVYTVKDPQGRIQTRSSEASSRRSLLSRLRGQGLSITEIRQVGGRADKSGKEKLSILSIFKPKVKVGDLAVFSRQFATMIDAGVPLAQCLDILSVQTENTTLAKATAEIKIDVESGGNLSEALAKHSKIFEALYTNMVRAGEASGALPVIFNQLADLLERERELRNRIKSALFMPIMVLGLCLVISAGLILFVVPKFAGIFEQLGSELPGPTQALINLSQTIRSLKGLVIAAVVVLFVFLFKAITKTEKGGYIWDQAKLKMPLFGSLIMKRVVASFARVFSLLERSGVPILESLDIVANTTGNRVVSRAIKEARSSIEEGESISTPLGKSQIFPPMVTHMIVVGEETGSVEIMLTKIADLYEDEVQRKIEGLTSLIEPMMMVVIGVLVGGILICMYLPIFNMAGAIGTGG